MDRCYSVTIVEQSYSHAWIVTVYEIDPEFKPLYLTSTEVGPSDTCHDMCRWLTRHLAPRMGLPLR